MKSKAERLSILKDLIKRADEEQYGVKGNMKACAEDAEIFIRQCTDRQTYRKWQKETIPMIKCLYSENNQAGIFLRNKHLNDQQWIKWLADRQRSWIIAKKILLDALNMVYREIEIYGEDKDKGIDTDDPFESLKQRLLEIIDEISDVADTLEERIGDMEGRLDDLNGQLDDIEGRLDDLEGRLDNLEERTDDIESRADEIESIIDEAEECLDDLESNTEDNE